MKKILVTGASGLLGLNFCLTACKKYEVVGIAHQTQLGSLPFPVLHHDLGEETPGEILDRVRPDILLHCAAIADIDKCEKNPEAAMKMNSELPGKLAAEAGRRGIKFIHISTDAVFDGEACGPDGYKEEDSTNPLSCYAETKLRGEENVLSESEDALVARVNFYGWSSGGKRSLAEFFYNRLKAGDPVNGFKDVYVSTLYVRYLVQLLMEAAELDAKGLYHVFSADYQSKYAFGVSIAETFGFDATLITPISWKDGGLTAKRSPNLIMNTEKLQKLLGHALPEQKDSVAAFYEDSRNGYRGTIQNHE